MPGYSILIKPASADCNLRCHYCFYLPVARNYPESAVHRMDDRTLERVVRRFMATPQKVHTFGWQGGEPLLMGLPFFRRAVELQEASGVSGVRVANGLQTNGTLLNDDWAAFFAQYHFLLGVSLDGPAALHDAERVNIAGEGSHAAVLAGIASLRRHQVEFNILTLVNRSNVGHPVDVYNYLVDQGFFFHQYIECVEADASGTLHPYAVDGEAWGRFLCAIFDRWFERDTRRVSVRLFDTILARLLDDVANTCAAATNCCQYLVVEHNGDLYPCDFHVRPEWRLGNIHDTDFETVWHNASFRAFGRGKVPGDPACAGCLYLRFCQGDCPKNRAGTPKARSRLCEGWKIFYAHTLPRFQELAEQIRRDRRAAACAQTSAMPGRNDPCPCGSGRKFKVCCGR